ncbi:mechanosensitive ion channel family protein [Methanosarcina sp. Mfa9]|uniref:mechanosensitive ion channel family protein n=1 Tax=Methanosarcina sp. Mfa9 TaxID=3439063 RepID=UPI003F850BCA
MANGIMEQTIPYTDLTVSTLLFAIIVLVAGFVIAKFLVSMFRSGIKSTKLPELVVEFLTRFLSILLYIMVVFAFLGTLGFDINGFVIGLSAVVGLVLGFGLQDTLTNLAAGVWIAALRPIDMGEYVKVNGESGTVKAVGIMATELLTPDNQYITIPNKLIWGSPVINSTRMPTRRVSVDVGIGYSSDLEKAIRVAIELMKGHSLVLTEPEPAVVTTELADSSVNLQLRAWTNTGDFWTVKNELTAGIFEAYRKEGIEIPFPQLSVHLEKN